MTDPTIEDVQALLAQFEQSGWDELRVQIGDFELHTFKTARANDAVRPARGAPAPVASVAAAVGAAAAPIPADTPAATPGAEVDYEAAGLRLHVIRSAILGTFYSQPKPGADPFVTVGQEVSPGTELCIVEIMKLFTTVESDVSGIVREILVKDAELVEHDQPLFVIERTDA